MINEDKMIELLKKEIREPYKENAERGYSNNNLAWTREQIEKNKTFLDEVLDSLPYPFYVIDVSNHKIIAANSASQFGQLSNSATCYQLTHNTDKPCNSDSHQCPLETIKETKRPVTIEHLHYDKEKNPLNVEIHAFPIFDAKENVSHIVEYVLDISDRKRAEKALQRANKKLNDDLTEAANYVKSMLPPPITEGPVKISWRFVPSASLGGDTFGYRWLDNEYFAIYLIDACGHGVGPALLSVSVLNLLNSSNLSNTVLKNPAQVLKTLNMTFPGKNHNDMFFSVWYGVYHAKSRKLIYASGGHPPALMFNGSYAKILNIVRLGTHNHMIGVLPNISFQQDIHHVDPGATLYLFSDGVYEITKRDGSVGKLDEFETLIADLHAKGHKANDKLLYETDANNGKEVFEDDYTLLNVAFP